MSKTLIYHGRNKPKNGIKQPPKFTIGFRYTKDSHELLVILIQKILIITKLINIFEEEIDICTDEMNEVVLPEHRQYYKGRRKAFKEVIELLKDKT